MSELPSSLSIAEAATATGLSSKAIRRRSERGTLRKVTGQDGRIRVLRADLEAAGLLPTEAVALPGVPGEMLESLSPAALFDRLQSLGEELGRHRLLEDQAEGTRAELAEARDELARLRAELEAARKRWWRRG